jgi:hypothetical protein
MASAAPDPDSELIQLLNNLELLPPSTSTPPTGTFDPGAAEFQVLKSGVTKITGWVSRLIAAAGGAGAVWAAVEAYFNRSRPDLQITLVASAAAIIGLAALAMALVISADLRARAEGSAAQYHARGQVAAAYEFRQGGGPQAQTTAQAPVQTAAQTPAQAAGLTPAQAAAQTPAQAAAQTPAQAAATAWSGDLPITLLALATSGTQVRARLKDTDEELYLTGVRYKSGSLKVRLTAGAAEPSAVGSWYEVDAIDEFDTTS